MLANNNAIGPMYPYTNVAGQSTSTIRATYGTSALYELANVSIPLPLVSSDGSSIIVDNTLNGLPYGFVINGIASSGNVSLGTACGNILLRQLQQLNPSLYGFADNACCNVGLVDEMCCSAYCPPPRPTPPPYCIIDQYTDTSSDNYLYTMFDSLQTAVTYCRASPVKLIYVARQRFEGDLNGYLGVLMTRVQPVPSVALSANDPMQLVMILQAIPADLESSLNIPFDANVTRPQFVGYSYQLDTSFDLVVLFGIDFVYDPA